MRVTLVGINLSLTLCNHFSTSLWMSHNYTLGPVVSASGGFNDESSAEKDRRVGAAPQSARRCWKAGGKCERKTDLEKKRERGRKEERRIRWRKWRRRGKRWKGEGEKGGKRKRERHSFPCIAICNLFHHLPLVCAVSLEKMTYPKQPCYQT